MRISDWSSDVCSSDLPVMGDGAFRPLAGTDGHFLAVVRRPGKRRIDLSGRGHGDARDDCQIAALYAVARELGGEAFMRGNGLGDDAQARGALVAPMDDAGPGAAADARNPARDLVAPCFHHTTP